MLGTHQDSGIVGQAVWFMLSVLDQAVWFMLRVLDQAFRLRASSMYRRHIGRDTIQGLDILPKSVR